MSIQPSQPFDPFGDVIQVIAAIGESAKAVRSIMIAGGGRIAFNVAKALERKKNITIKIIENNQERCEFLARYLNNAIIFKGEASDLYF